MGYTRKRYYYRVNAGVVFGTGACGAGRLATLGENRDYLRIGLEGYVGLSVYRSMGTFRCGWTLFVCVVGGCGWEPRGSPDKFHPQVCMFECV